MRKIILALALILCASGAKAQIRGAVQTTTGQAVAGAIVTVCSYSSGSYNSSGQYTGSFPCSPASTIYYDPALTQAITTLLSDGQGNYFFYAAAGNYTVTITAPGRIQSYGFSATINSSGSGCIPGGSAGALQKNSNPTGSCNAAALVDNGTTITASEPVVVPSLNKVVYADQEAGATADVKVAAAITALGAPGGTVDARGFGATSQLWAATVTVPQGVTINFDPKTYFGPSSAALNLFKVEPSAWIDGFTLDCSSQPTYSGNVFENDPTQAYTASQNTRIDDVLILCGGVGTGNGLYLNSTSLPVVWIRTSHWRQTGLLNQILMTASGNGFVNDNHFLDMQMDGAGTGITAVQFHMTPNGGQIDGNQCIQCSFQSESSTDLGWLVDGTSGTNDQVSDNLFIGDCWDSTVICVNFSGNIKAESNQYIGLSNHGISDTNGSNGNYSYSNFTAIGGIFIGGFPTETGPTQITHNSGSAVSGVTGSNYCLGGAHISFLQCLDTSGNMGLAGSLYIKQNASPSNPSSGSDLLNFDTSDIFGPLTSAGAFTRSKWSGLIAAGTATLTGTGACATNSTQKGGAWAGQATCTGTTGASTFVITPGTTAPNGWSCTASDLTTAANILRQSAVSTTACTIAGTVNANDVLTFTAMAY